MRGPRSWWRFRKFKKRRAKKVTQFQAAGVEPVSLDEWRRFMLRSSDPTIVFIPAGEETTIIDGEVQP